MCSLDILLKNGDHATDPRGLPVILTETDEQLQRALLRLCIRRGSFAYDKTLGSELYRLSGGEGEGTNRTAQSYIQEALLPLPEVRVGEVICKRGGTGEFSVTAALECQNEQYEVKLEA